MQSVRNGTVVHRFVEIDGSRLFYREAGHADGPTVLLLHGFPTSSHQFGRLIDAVGDRCHLIAPDYPGFGHSDPPPRAGQGLVTFDRIADAIEKFCQALGLDRMVIYMFDFGGPVGMRLASRHPEWVAGLVVQNSNAYEEGLSEMAWGLLALRADRADDVAQVQSLCEPAAIRQQYLHGAADPEAVSPDGWTLDGYILAQPGRRQVQVDLNFDYGSNVALYPAWQKWLRDQQPPMLIVWGRGDPFFSEAGAWAYMRDIPRAEVHLFETGHFALEEKVAEIAPLVGSFAERAWSRREPHSLKICVLGASGHLGRAIAAEAAYRGHAVTAVARDASRLEDLPASAVAADVLDRKGLDAVVAGHDVVISALAGRDPGRERTVPDATRMLLEALPDAGVTRLVVVGGGGSLEGTPGQRFVDAPGFPTEYKQEALAAAEALELLRSSKAPQGVRWSYFSPPPMHLIDGPRTGKFRVAATDSPITDETGDSRLSIGDLAAAVVDDVETDAFVGRRFTAAH